MAKARLNHKEARKMMPRAGDLFSTWETDHDNCPGVAIILSVGEISICYLLSHPDGSLEESEIRGRTDPVWVVARLKP